MLPASVTSSGPEPALTQQAALPGHCCMRIDCATTELMQTAHLEPDNVCLAGHLELQTSTVAGTKTWQSGAVPKPPMGRSTVTLRHK